MTQSKDGSGAVIVAVIVLGAVWVSCCMFLQPPGDPSSGTPIPRIPNLSPQSRAFLSAKQNPYVAALLGPKGASRKTGETKRFSELLSKKLEELDLEKKGPGFIQLHHHLLTKGETEAMSLARGPKDGQEPRAPARAVDATARYDMDKLLSQTEAAYDKADTNLGLVKVKEALAYATAHPELPSTARIDILFSGSRLCYQANNFDQSRKYVNQAIALAHQNQDYKMDDLEGVRCLLTGNGGAASDYNVALAQYNESLAQSSFTQLPALADTLIGATKSLPDDSYFRLQAQLNKAGGMLLAGSKPAETEVCIKKVEALAQKAQDEKVVASCEDLLVRLRSQ